MHSKNEMREELSFVRSGYVRLHDGYLLLAGRNGVYWSRSAASTNTDAYYLSFNATTVGQSFGSNRFYGSSLRCLQE